VACVVVVCGGVPVVQVDLWFCLFVCLFVFLSFLSGHRPITHPVASASVDGATKGWDPATGLGVPNFEGMKNYVVNDLQ
jgi:hypothetical protein